jgi:hypothetical protein
MAPIRQVSLTTSSAYQAFGIRGDDSIRTKYRGGQVICTIAQDAADCRCAACGSREVISRGPAERRFRSLAIGRRTATVVLPIPRVEYRACSAVRLVKVPSVVYRPTHTKLSALRPGNLV